MKARKRRRFPPEKPKRTTFYNKCVLGTELVFQGQLILCSRDVLLLRSAPCKVTDVLTKIPGVNKTDALNLLTAFGSIRALFKARCMQVFRPTVVEFMD